MSWQCQFPNTDNLNYIFWPWVVIKAALMHFTFMMLLKYGSKLMAFKFPY